MITTKARILVEQKEVEAGFCGCVRFSRYVETGEAQAIQTVAFNSEMHAATGFARPPVAIKLWARETLLLGGQLAPGMDLSDEVRAYLRTSGLEA